MAETIRPHSLTLESRSKLTISGVTDVESFNEQMVVLSTESGPLTVLGDQLKIGRLSLEDGRLLVEGSIAALSYDEKREKGSLIRRMFR